MSVGYALIPGLPDQSDVRATNADLPSFSGIDFELIACVAYDQWVGSGVSWQPIITKHQGGAIEYMWQLREAGGDSFMRLEVHDNTNTQNVVANSDPFTDPGDGEVRWLRVVLRGDVAGTREVDFYTSADPADTAVGAVTWAQLGASETGAAITSINDTTAPTRLMGSSFAGNQAAGRYFLAEIYDDATETTRLANPDFRTDDQGWSTPPGIDDEGVAWTFNNAAVWVAPSTPGDSTCGCSFGVSCLLQDAMATPCLSRRFG